MGGKPFTRLPVRREALMKPRLGVTITDENGKKMQRVVMPR